MASSRPSLADRVAIITGASSGIGAATARAFAQAGAKVVLAARSQAALDEVAGELPGIPLAIATDVTDRESVQALITRTVEQHGRIDMLVNNAGVGLVGPISQLDPGDLLRILHVDLLGPIYLTQVALPYMRPRPGSRARPQIIQVSSVVALRALPYHGGYAGAKAALERVSEALRVELGARNIVVTVVRPGTTSTNFRARRLGHGKEQRRVTPRGATPERVAEVIVRAALRQPRVAYVSWRDRLMLAANSIVPGAVDRILERTIGWES